jgi:hypothetical protein
LNLDEFIVGDDDHEPIVPQIRAPSPGELETARRLQEMARGINRRAALRRHEEIGSDGAVEDATPCGSANPDFLEMLSGVANSDTHLLETLSDVTRTEVRGNELYSFRVPVCVVSKLKALSAHCLIIKPRRANFLRESVLSLRSTDAYKPWVANAFTVPHLPGRLFVFGPAEFISRVRSNRMINSQPVLVPRSEWAHGIQSPLFTAWGSRRIQVGFWVRILAGGTYHGDLGYVIGSSTVSDRLLVAVVPRISYTAAVQATAKRTDAQSSGPPAKRQKHARAVQPALFNRDRAVLIFGSDSVQTCRVPASGIRAAFEGKFPSLTMRTEGAEEEELHIDLEDFIVLNHLGSAVGVRQEIHKFRRKFYFHGLCILPIYAYGAVEPSTTRTASEITPFAESYIDPGPVDAILSQLHWQAGDRVLHVADNSVYQIADVQLVSESVTLTCPDGVIHLPPLQLRRHFKLGDDLVVLAGSGKGRTGQVVFIGTDLVTILTSDSDGTQVSSYRRIPLYHV